jgi:uncharacterized protein
MADPLRPIGAQTDPAERIQSLDILRGFALVGMLIVHFHDRSTEPGGIDDVIRTLIWRLVESKSHGTFALLFGAGFAIQLRRAQARGVPFAGRYLRRLAVLAVFGFCAHAFFGFNVLLGYAVWGVPLLLIRNWSTRALIVTAVLSAASVLLYNIGMFWYLSHGVGPEAARAAGHARVEMFRAVNHAVTAAEAQSSYAVLFVTRLKHMAWFYRQPFFFMPGVTIALFIAGLLLVRHRVFENVGSHRRLLAGLAVFGIVSWLVDDFLFPDSGFDNTLGVLRDQWLMFAYVSVALLLLAWKPGLLVRLRVIGNAGRMALTNYLIQIAAIDLLFSGYAIGLGRVRPVIALPMALTLFAAQVAFSTVWLARCRFGPAEWLWRSLTYGQRQPMRRAPGPIGSAARAVDSQQLEL